MFLLGTIWFVLGAAIGSFLNVVVLRMPKGEPITGYSRCPVCKARLRYSELIPLVSFILLKGKCKNCNTGISWRYPILNLDRAIVLGFWLAISPQTLAEYFFFLNL